MKKSSKTRKYHQNHERIIENMRKHQNISELPKIIKTSELVKKAFHLPLVDINLKFPLGILLRPRQVI
jgi:hypothetical protein